MPKDNINLVDDVTCLLSHFSVSRLENCNRITNRVADVLAEKALMY